MARNQANKSVVKVSGMYLPKGALRVAFCNQPLALGMGASSAAASAMPRGLNLCDKKITSWSNTTMKSNASTPHVFHTAVLHWSTAPYAQAQMICCLLAVVS